MFRFGNSFSSNDELEWENLWLVEKAVLAW